MTKQNWTQRKTGMVWQVWKKVKANGGSSGVDGKSIADFEGNIEKELYKVWNRLSSWSYFPPFVKQVLIPKKDGKQRKLGIPTVGDRVAQQVIKTYLEPRLESTSPLCQICHLNNSSNILSEFLCL